MESGGVEGAPKLNIPWIESPFFSRELAARADVLSPAHTKIAAEFNKQGYATLEGLVPATLCDEIRAQTEALWVSDPTANRQPDGWRLGASSVRELAILPEILDILRMLYERQPLPFQTLNFKRGTEQMPHSDSIHFSSFPPRFMCGVWVALEDVSEDCGPLFYHPGTQRLPETSLYDLDLSVDDPWFDRYGKYELFQQDLMAQLDSKPVPFIARKGDALIWSSNVVHGGSPIWDQDSTRWSQVTHYLFSDCMYYQPHSSILPLGELKIIDITDLATMQVVPQMFNGQPLEVEPLPSGRSRVRLAAAPAPEVDTTPADVPAEVGPAAPADIHAAPSKTRPPLIQSAIRQLRRKPAGRAVLGAARGALDGFRSS